MKITFLGTSHGVPSGDRHCSSAMIEVGSNIYFIDAGAPMVEGVLKAGLNMNNVKAVFVTHHHLDHINDLPHMVGLSTWYFKESRFDVYLPEQAAIDGTVAFITSTGIAEPPSDRLVLKVYDENTVYDDGVVRVSFYPTKHLEKVDRPAYSILVEAEGKRVFFSGDLSQNIAKNDFPVYTMENETDMFVLEMAHFYVEHIAAYLPKVKTKVLYFNHVFPLLKYEHIASLDGTLPYPVKTVDDNDVIEL